MPYSWLLLIRHGRTEANRKGIYAGRSAVALDDVGLRQSEALARRLAELPVRAVYSSPVARAEQTAKLIAPGLGLSVQTIEELSELRMSAWQGLGEKELAARYPVEWLAWSRNPAALDCPHLESLSSLAARARRVVSEVGRRHAGESVALITHEAVIRVILLVSLGMDLRHYRAFRIAPGSLSVLGWKPDSARLMLLSDTSHQDQGRVCFLAAPPSERPV